MNTNTVELQVFTTQWTLMALRHKPHSPSPSGSRQRTNTVRALADVAHRERSPNPSTTEQHLSSLLQNALEISVELGRIEWHEPFLRIQADLRLARPLYLAVREAKPASVDFLLHKTAKPPRVDSFRGTNLGHQWAHPCCHSPIGLALLLWALDQPHRDTWTRRAEVVRLLLEHPGIDFSRPCWEVFTAIDMCAMMATETPSAGYLRRRHFQDAEPSPVTRIAGAATAENATAQLGQLLEAGHVSPLDLELVLRGASLLNCVKLVELLLRYGTHPDSPNIGALRSHARNGRRRGCGLSRDYLLGRSSYWFYGREEVDALLIEHGATISDETHRILGRPHFRTGALGKSVRGRLLNGSTAGVPWKWALDLAVGWGDLAFFEALLERAPDKAAKENTSLQAALGWYKTEAIKSFWERGARLPLASDGKWDMSNLWRSTDLDPESAASTLRYLLDQGASPNCLFELLFHWGKHSSLLELTNILLQAGADPNQIGTSHNMSPILTAFRLGRFDLVETLVRAGAKIQDRDILRKVLVSLPPTSQDSQQLVIAKVFELCHSQGVDVSEVASRALVGAASAGYVNIAADLLKAGVDVNGGTTCKDNECSYCKTPLEAAARMGHMDMVKLLVNAGAEGFCPAPDSGIGGTNSLPDLGEVTTVEQIPALLGELRITGRRCPAEERCVAGQRSKRFQKAIALAQWNPLVARMLEEYQANDWPMSDEEAALYARSCPIKEEQTDDSEKSSSEDGDEDEDEDEDKDTPR